MMNRIAIRSTVSVAGALAVGALGFAGLASADPDAVPSAMLNTTCSLDQLMAATKVVDPITYGELVEKYNSEPAWIQGAVVNHLNLLLEKPAEQRQAEVDELARIFPAYVPLFQTAEPTANEIAEKCPTYPAVDPAVWNAAAPAPAPVAEPAPAATESAAPEPATASETPEPAPLTAVQVPAPATASEAPAA